MQTTGNLGLKKPEGTDIVDIAELNGNMDILDNTVNSKVDKVTGKQLSTNDYTAAEKTKLAGIAAGANNYAHPNHTGDVTSTGDGVTAIAAGVIVDADVNSAADIGWTKISKTGSSLADLATKSAADLSSGTLLAARMPAISGDITIAVGTTSAVITAGAIVNADVNAAAAIDVSKIGTGVVSNAEFNYLDGVTSGIQGQLDGKTAIVDYIRQPAYAVTSGTLIAYTVTLTPAPASLAEGFGITIVPNVTNGANPTLNINALGAIALKDQKGVAYTAGKLLAGKPYMFRRVGTDFLADSSGGAGDALAGDIRAGKKAATDAGDIVGTLAVQAGGTVTPGASAIVKAAGIYDTAITVSAVSVPAVKVLAGTTIAGTAGMMPDNAGITRDSAGMTLSGGDLYLNTPEGYYNPTSSIRYKEANLAEPKNWRSDKMMFGRAGTMPIITAGDDVALSVGKWPSGDLAVYPREGYRKGGAGAGEVKVTVAQMQSVNAYLQPQYIKAGAEICGIVGTLVEKRSASGTLTATNYYATVTGLAFTPSIIEVTYFRTTWGSTTKYIYTGWRFLAGYWNQAVSFENGWEATGSVTSNGFSVYISNYDVGNLITWRAFE